MPMKRRSDKHRLAFPAETIVYVHDDRDSPDYPRDMSKFWHEYSLEKGHVHGTKGYSVRQACEAYGIDPDELLQRIRARREAAWAAAGPEQFDEHGHTIIKRES